VTDHHVESPRREGRPVGITLHQISRPHPRSPAPPRHRRSDALLGRTKAPSTVAPVAIQ